MSPVCAADGASSLPVRLASLVLLSRLELLPAAATTLDCLPASTGLTQKPVRRRLVCLACTTCSLTVSLLLTITHTSITVLSHTRRGVVLFNLAQPCRSVQYKPRPQHTHTSRRTLLPPSQHNILPLPRSFPTSPLSRRTNADLAPTHATV